MTETGTGASALLEDSPVRLEPFGNWLCLEDEPQSGQICPSKTNKNEQDSALSVRLFFQVSTYLSVRTIESFAMVSSVTVLSMDRSSLDTESN